MNADVVEVSIKGVMPTSNGCAVFLGNDDKTIVIYVDQGIGNALSMAMNQVRKERPLTHDLIGYICKGLGAEIQRIVINDVDDGTFYARLFLKMENELGTKVVEIDARPSDSMVLAVQNEKPIYVAREVMDAVEDMTEILERILKQQN
ncbi:MAG: bifunctional nuclease family protein [Opitutales bacterium]